MRELINTFITVVVSMLLVTGPLLLLEALWPRSKPSISARLRGAMFLVIFAIAAALVSASLPNVPPVFTLSEHGWIAAPITLLAYDFLYYWMHRLQHRALWRFHAVHHSIEELGALNYHHHITEPLISAVLITVPMFLFLGSDALGGVALGGIILLLHGNFIHTATRVNFGPLRCLLVDNSYHRIHHSIEPEHWGRNFAVIFTIWDRVFGTHYHPKSNEWPATGTPDQAELRTIVEYVFRPFQPANSRLDIP